MADFKEMEVCLEKLNEAKRERQSAWEQLELLLDSRERLRNEFAELSHEDKEKDMVITQLDNIDIGSHRAKVPIIDGSYSDSDVESDEESDEEPEVAFNPVPASMSISKYSPSNPSPLTLSLSVALGGERLKVDMPNLHDTKIKPIIAMKHHLAVSPTHDDLNARIKKFDYLN